MFILKCSTFTVVNHCSSLYRMLKIHKSCTLIMSHFIYGWWKTEIRRLLYEKSNNLWSHCSTLYNCSDKKNFYSRTHCLRSFCRIPLAYRNSIPVYINIEIVKQPFSPLYFDSEIGINFEKNIRKSFYLSQFNLLLPWNISRWK